MFISVVIPTYNRLPILKKCLLALENQQLKDDKISGYEVVLVDDGSTDKSRHIIKSYGDRLIPVFKENGGQASTFNAGFAASRGEIICLLDSDDTFELEKISTIVDIFSTYPHASWCFHAVKLEDKSTRKFLGVTQEKGSRECDFRHLMKQGRLFFLAPPTSGLCFKRSLLQSVLPMPEAFKRGADRYLVAVTPALIVFLMMSLTRTAWSKAF